MHFWHLQCEPLVWITLKGSLTDFVRASSAPPSPSISSLTSWRSCLFNSIPEDDAREDEIAEDDNREFEEESWLSEPSDAEKEEKKDPTFTPVKLRRSKRKSKGKMSKMSPF